MILVCIRACVRVHVVYPAHLKSLRTGATTRVEIRANISGLLILVDGTNDVTADVMALAVGEGELLIVSSWKTFS